jgi:hypothetical protein
MPTNVALDAWLLKMWERNVKTLADAGHDITVMVCLSGNVINEIEPIDIINELADKPTLHSLSLTKR